MEPECVTAVCCLGFPLLSLDGYRGQNIDPLLDVKCPVFIAVGSAAANSDIDELEDMRDQFKCKSKLLVVEGADSLLRVPTDIQLKNKECHFKFRALNLGLHIGTILKDPLRIEHSSLRSSCRI